LDGAAVVGNTEGTSVGVRPVGAGVVAVLDGAAVVGNTEGTSVGVAVVGAGVLASLDGAAVVGSTEGTSVGVPVVGAGVVGSMDGAAVVGNTEGTNVGVAVVGAGVVASMDGAAVVGNTEGTSVGVAVVGAGVVAALVGEKEGGLLPAGLLVGIVDGPSDGTGRPAMDNMKFLKRLKSMDPRPDAGSHPGVAEKPCLQHTLSAVQLFLPTVTSFMNWEGYWYKTG
jgi:hypothetical protein